MTSESSVCFRTGEKFFRKRWLAARCRCLAVSRATASITEQAMSHHANAVAQGAARLRGDSHAEIIQTSGETS